MGDNERLTFFFKIEYTLSTKITATVARQGQFLVV